MNKAALIIMQYAFIGFGLTEISKGNVKLGLSMILFALYFEKAFVNYLHASGHASQALCFQDNYTSLTKLTDTFEIVGNKLKTICLEDAASLMDGLNAAVNQFHRR